MKRIRFYVCMMLLAFTLVGLTGCSNKNNGKNPTTGNPTTVQPTTATVPATTKGTTGTSSTVDESSTGVIDGLMDDVKKGVDDVTGETTTGTTSPTK